ncbi:MAG: S-layer homology domain-containing protein, partial [Clostridia bacterium]|nr:S-layer homology domain-containing protein [Clostridia bacterium]
LNGYDDGTYKPTQPASRKELAKIAMVAFKYEQVQDKLDFNDEATIPAWAYGYVSSAVKNGIITGYEDGTFLPDKNVTRAETCTILVKCLKL